VAPPTLLDEVLAVSRTNRAAADVVNSWSSNSALGEVLASGLRSVNADPRCTEADLRATMEGPAALVAHGWSATSARWRPSPPRRPCWACSARWSA
jgi:biopolymer transport protein ExbB